MSNFFKNLQLIKDEEICLLGIPFDEHSSYLKGPAKAPDEIRSAYKSESVNTSTESIRDLSKETAWTDLGNVEINDYHKDIKEAINSILKLNKRPLILGGDHSITYQIMKAFSNKYDHLTILQLDAHGDLYDEFDGNRFSHACPFARIMEEKLAEKLIQVGIRTMTPEQQEQTKRFNIKVFDMRSLANMELNLSDLTGPLYLSLDMDVLDPAFAPGISHCEPGGMSTREVLNIIREIPVPLVGADIVELNPTRDLNGMTAMAAAKFLKEILDHMLEKHS